MAQEGLEVFLVYHHSPLYIEMLCCSKSVQFTGLLSKSQTCIKFLLGFTPLLLCREYESLFPLYKPSLMHSEKGPLNGLVLLDMVGCSRVLRHGGLMIRPGFQKLKRRYILENSVQSSIVGVQLANNW